MFENPEYNTHYAVEWDFNFKWWNFLMRKLVRNGVFTAIVLIQQSVNPVFTPGVTHNQSQTFSHDKWKILYLLAQIQNFSPSADYELIRTKQREE